MASSNKVTPFATKESKDTDVLLEKRSNSGGSATGKKKSLLIILVLSVVLLIVAAILLFGVYYDEVFGESSSDEQTVPTTGGMIGLWPCYGGNLGNQQTSPNPEKIEIDDENILNMTTHCEYDSDEGVGYLGFPTIDDEYNAYFTDLSGFITKYDIQNCQEVWRVNIAEMLGYNSSEVLVGTHQSLTLFQDKLGRRGALFGAPSRRPYPSGGYSYVTYPPLAGCWAIALSLDDGEPLWTLEVAEGYNPLNWRCNIHGFFVDGDYAYGGLAQSGNHLNGSNIIGRMFKIDISLEEPEVVDIWYPFDPALTAAYDEPHWSYLGAGAYNFPALIDDYLVFGTGQIYRTPKYIDDCLLGDDESDYNESLPFDQSVSTDVCGNDRSDDRFWRCLEKDVYPDSLIILNKNTFDIVAAIPMQGIDVYFWSSCWTSTSYAPWACPSVREGDNRPNQGPNADVSAVATFRYNGKLYAAASQKPSQLIVVEIPSGNLVVSKSFGPWTNGANFNMAVDEESGIGILTTRGASMYELNPKVRMCSGSSVHAINLLTGVTLWQIANPYGRINETDCWTRQFPLDRSIEQTCDYGEYLEEGAETWEDIIVADRFQEDNVINTGSGFSSPVTIIKNMVFIPGSSGDIWVHDLFDGSFIAHFQCPTIELEDGRFTRPGFKGGVSVIDRYIVYYCGDYGGGSTRNGNILVVQKLD